MDSARSKNFVSTPQAAAAWHARHHICPGPGAVPVLCPRIWPGRHPGLPLPFPTTPTSHHRWWASQSRPHPSCSSCRWRSVPLCSRNRWVLVADPTSFTPRIVVLLRLPVHVLWVGFLRKVISLSRGMGPIELFQLMMSCSNPSSGDALCSTRKNIILWYHYHAFFLNLSLMTQKGNKSNWGSN
jgi:hypothetical protein